jgi:hypothetical protein
MVTRLHFAWPRRWICAPRRTMPPPAGKKAGSYLLAVYAPWRTRSTCPNPRRMFPHLTCRWEREYEINVRALSLREEVADRRPWSTGPERPAGLKAGGPAGLSVPPSTVTPVPCTGIAQQDLTDRETGSWHTRLHCMRGAYTVHVEHLKALGIARVSPVPQPYKWSSASQAPTTGITRVLLSSLP